MGPQDKNPERRRITIDEREHRNFFEAAGTAEVSMGLSRQEAGVNAWTKFSPTAPFP